MSLLIASAVASLAMGVAPPEEVDLTELSLEELGNVEVTSVSRTKEPLGGAAAAVTVLTQEDIRRSGATNLPSVLRQVPGIHVAHVTSSAQAVGSRGFTSVQSNKLLILVDGRSIYTPLFSGVFWDAQDLLLEDVERLEVVRGPGASMWGANAVNGVINVTTKRAQDTQGLFFQAGGGTEERAFGALRYGTRVAEGLHVRVFAKYFNRDGSVLEDGSASPDRWWMSHLGMRADWDLSTDDTVTVQADGYVGRIGQVKPTITIIGREGPQPPLRIGVSGGNVLSRWTHRFSDTSDLQLRAYYDHTRRDDPSFLDYLDTVDVDFQHRFALPLEQELLWGVAYRLTANRNQPGPLFVLSPANATDHLISGFLQDRIQLPGGVLLTLGTKLEHNTFSGFELQPTARVAWEPGGGNTVWAAVSRAVRVPTRLERDVFIDAADPASPQLPRLLGNPDYGAEELVAYELGYRWLAERFQLDIAGFHNRYRGLATLEFGEPFEGTSGQTIIPLYNQNLMDGWSLGGEVSATANVTRSWRLKAAYSHIRVLLEPKGEDINRNRFVAGATPRNQLFVQSYLDLPLGFAFDARFRYVGPVESAQEAPDGESSPGYAELDARLAWQGLRGLEVSLVGQNLLQAQHAEYPTTPLAQRGVYLKVEGRY